MNKIVNSERAGKDPEVAIGAQVSLRSLLQVLSDYKLSYMSTCTLGLLCAVH